MDDELQKKVAQLRAMGVKQSVPLLVEVLDGLTDRIKELGGALAAKDQATTKALQQQTTERNRVAMLTALKILSFTELEAIKQILQADELKTGEGILVASKIADQIGITRSVIVSGLSKLEGTGVLMSRSLGMKGTYVKVLIPEFSQALLAS